jgi:hypothetical protein
MNIRHQGYMLKDKGQGGHITIAIFNSAAVKSWLAQDGTGAGAEILRVS